MNIFTTTIKAVKVILSEALYKALFLAFSILAFVMFVIVPVWSTPGNSISFQISLFTFWNWSIFVILAPLISLLLTAQIYVFVRTKNNMDKAKNLGSVGSGLFGGYAGFLGAVFATASCSWCAVALLGFLGSGTVLFIAQNQLWIVLAAIAVLLFSLYLILRKVALKCNDC